MNLNSSSDEEDSPQLPPPPPPPPARTGTVSTTNSIDDELDSRTLGVPDLETLMPGDRVEVLWSHGAALLSMRALLDMDWSTEPPAIRRWRAQAGRGGESRSACSRRGVGSPLSSITSHTTTA